MWAFSRSQCNMNLCQVWGSDRVKIAVASRRVSRLFAYLLSSVHASMGNRKLDVAALGGKCPLWVTADRSKYALLLSSAPFVFVVTFMRCKLNWNLTCFHKYCTSDGAIMRASYFGSLDLLMWFYERLRSNLSGLISAAVISVNFRKLTSLWIKHASLLGGFLSAAHKFVKCSN